MKNLKLIGFLMILASSLMFIQCTSDPIQGPPGIAGIDGIDGINGTNGIDGVDGTASCVACHNEAHRAPIDASFKTSGHNEDTVQYNGLALTDYTNQGFFGGSCTPCHSEEGYINYLTGEPIVTLDDPSIIGCTTCHEKHSTFDFENDGHDFALRSFDPVTLMTDDSYTIDFNGTSNNCAFCHQPRTKDPIDDGAGMFTVTSSHWGPHHGPQATLLEGIQGANIVGSTAYPTPQTAAHRTGSSCVTCHMSADDGAGNGGHSFVVTDNGCAGCHSNGIPSEVGGLADKMAELGQLLEEVGIVHDGHPVLGTYTIKEAQAAWNYLLVMEDASGGVHNPKYVKALIENSLEVLK